MQAMKSTELQGIIASSASSDMTDIACCLQAIAFILGILAVCYSVVTTCVESRAMDLEAQEDDSELLPYRPDFFHAIFALASAYLCMLYISWNLNTLPSLHGDSKFQVTLLSTTLLSALCWRQCNQGRLQEHHCLKRSEVA